MIDEIFDRQYQAGREQLHEGIDRAIARLRYALGTTFRTIRNVQFNAPWTTARSRQGGAAHDA